MSGSGRDLFMVGSGGDVEVQERHQRHSGRSTSMVTPVNIISEIDYDNLTTYTGALVARSITSNADPSYGSEGVSEVIYGRNRAAGVDKFKRVIAKTDHLLRSGRLGVDKFTAQLALRLIMLNRKRAVLGHRLIREGFITFFMEMPRDGCR